MASNNIPQFDKTLTNVDTSENSSGFVAHTLAESSKLNGVLYNCSAGITALLNALAEQSINNFDIPTSSDISTLQNNIKNSFSWDVVITNNKKQEISAEVEDTFAPIVGGARPIKHKIELKGNVNSSKGTGGLYIYHEGYLSAQQTLTQPDSINSSTSDYELIRKKDILFIHNISIYCANTDFTNYISLYLQIPYHSAKSYFNTGDKVASWLVRNGFSYATSFSGVSGNYVVETFGPVSGYKIAKLSGSISQVYSIYAISGILESKDYTAGGLHLFEIDIKNGTGNYSESISFDNYDTITVTDTVIL